MKNQTYTQLEIIVVDDGSTDATATLIEKHFPNVRCIRQENAGQAAARNCGVAESSGKFLAFLDSDDLWLPEKIEAQVQLIQAQKNVSLVFCDYESFGNEPGLPGFQRGPILRTLKTKQISNSGRVIQEEDLLSPLLRDMYCQVPSCWMITREHFEMAGKFDTTLREGGEDWLLAIRLANLGYLSFDNRRLVKRREHHDSHSRQNSALVGLAQAMIRLVSVKIEINQEFLSTVKRSLAYSCLYIAQAEAEKGEKSFHWFISAYKYSKSLNLREKIKINISCIIGILSFHKNKNL